LEFYHLGDLRLVGFIQQGKHTQALIRVHGQQSLGIHSVRIGDYLGKNFGRVLQITDQTVVLKELQQDASGLWSGKETNLQLVDGNI
jgi:type IV pilus assembly protein PilP